MLMFAVLGASGKVGRATIEKLRAQGASVRAVVRESSNPADLEALGCQIAFADLHNTDEISKAIAGATAVQVICPVTPRAKDAATEMENIIDAIAGALTATRPERILAISDYGAQIDSGTGITMIFHYMEARLSTVPGTLIFLRSAEHMQNWARVIKPSLETGVLPSFHHPVSKIFRPSPHPVLAESRLSSCSKSRQAQDPTSSTRKVPAIYCSRCGGNSQRNIGAANRRPGTPGRELDTGA
jgi:NAD(P)H dehydrogenase (quinone)